MTIQQLTERPDPLAHVRPGDTGRAVPIPGSRPHCGHPITAQPPASHGVHHPCTRSAGHPGQHIASSMTAVLAVAPQAVTA